MSSVNKKIKSKISEASVQFFSSHKCILLGVTGAGKTTAAIELITNLANQTKRNLSVKYVAPKIILGESVSESMWKAFDECRNVKRFSASVNAVTNRIVMKNKESLSNADVVIFDEGHHIMSKKMYPIAKNYIENCKKRGAYVIVLTATPKRSDGQDIRCLFDESEQFELASIEDATPFVNFHLFTARYDNKYEFDENNRKVTNLESAAKAFRKISKMINSKEDHIKGYII